MRRLIAILMAFVLSIVSVVTYVNITGNRDSDKGFTGYVISYDKFKSPDNIIEQLDENTSVLLGSSELGSCSKSKCYPDNMLKGTGIDLMLLGGGNCQSLWQSIALGSIGDEIKNNKVVLIISPQWFYKDGVAKGAFADKFAEQHFINFIKNPNLSKETKQKITDRTKGLLSGDTETLKRVKIYEDMYIKNKPNLMDTIYVNSYNGLMNFQREYKYNKLKGSKRNEDNGTKFNLDEYLKIGEQEGALATNNNDFFIENNYYNKYVKDALKTSKGSMKNDSFAESVEYGDLNLFLQVCKELKIEPMLISVPVNGLWYDYCGFPKEGREKYYENIRQVAKDANVKLADLTEYENTTYFFDDVMHLGWKGWSYVNEAIYNFIKQD